MVERRGYRIGKATTVTQELIHAHFSATVASATSHSTSPPVSVGSAYFLHQTTKIKKSGEMRQRITYLLSQGTSVDPSTIKVTDNGLDFDEAETAAEERRITIGLSQLPREVWYNLCHNIPVPSLTHTTDSNLSRRLSRAPHPHRLSSKSPHNLTDCLATATWPPRILYAEDIQC